MFPACCFRYIYNRNMWKIGKSNTFHIFLSYRQIYYKFIFLTHTHTHTHTHIYIYIYIYIYTSSSVMYSGGPLHMDEQRQDDQLEPIDSSSVPIRDVTLKTCRKRWTIGRGGERG